MTEPLKIGDRVLVKAFLIRDVGPYPAGQATHHAYQGVPRVWVRISLASKELDGWIVGVRTLSDGVVTYDSERDFLGSVVAQSSEYRQTRAFKAYLVAPGMRNSFVRVLPEDLEVIDG